MTAQGGDPADKWEILAEEDTGFPMVWSPDPNPIAIGLCIIASIYLLPLFPAPTPATGLFTLADALASASTGSNTPSPMLFLTFWLGWWASLGMIIQGLVLKKTRPFV